MAPASKYILIFIFFRSDTMTSAGTNRVISPLENIPKEETLRLRDLHIGFVIIA